MNGRDANAICQVRVQGLIDHDTAAKLPEIGAKPSLKIQLREAEGKRTPWIPASVACLTLSPMPEFQVEIDAVLNLHPPRPSPEEPQGAKQRKPNAARGRPKLTAAERAARDRTIRAAYRAGAKQKDLAVEWGLTRATIYTICSKPEPEL